MNRNITEILSVLAEYSRAMSSKEIADELRMRGIHLEPRTVRYHLKKLEEIGLIRKTRDGKREITQKGLEELRRRSAFERLGEFSERIEFNVYSCTFDLYKMEGTVPTNVAIIDKDYFEDAVNVLTEVYNSEFSKYLVSKLLIIVDEDEYLGGIRIPNNAFGIYVISNTVYDVIMRSIGVSMIPEFAGLLHYEKHPKGFTELISYSGTTLSPGWLLIRSGLTSVYRCVKNGKGEMITAIRSFSRHAIEIVRDELEIAKSRGFGGIIGVSYPSSRSFSLPPGNRARLIVSAGLNYLAPFHELGLNPELRINEAFVDFKDFKPIEKIL